MDIRRLSPGYAVSPQISPQDAAELKAQGFATVICNRPDAEVPPGQKAADIRHAVEAQGMTFVENPVVSGALTMENVEVQGAAIAASPGPVFAYCASGNRSSIVWALSQAGKAGADELIAAAGRHGYRLEPLRGQIEALARARA